MPNFGEQLRREREGRGLSLDEVARSTNIGPHILEALEQNDFARLPGGPFNKGFVRSYARFLELDAESAVDAYGRAEKARGLWTPDAERDCGTEQNPLLEIRTEGDRKTLVVDWLLVRRALMIAPAVTIAAVGGWLLLRSWTPDPTPGVQPARAAERPVAADTPVHTSAVATGGDETLPALRAAEEKTLPPATVPASGEPETTRPPASSDEIAGENRALDDSAPTTTTASASREPEAFDSPAPSEEASDESRALAGAPPSPVAAAGSVSVPDSGVGTGVVDLRLIGENTEFEEGSEVWFWTRTVGGRQGDALKHVWIREGRPMVTYDLTIGGSHWRNSTLKTLSPGSIGQWSVEARGTDDRLLAREEFVCVPARVGDAGTGR